MGGKSQVMYNKTHKNKKSQKNQKTQIKHKKEKANLKYTKQKKVMIQEESLNILSTNASSLIHRADDLKNKITYFKCGIFAVNETHFRKKGRFKMQNYHVFEAIRNNKEKGGTMLGVHVGLHPVLISEYSTLFELIVVEIKIANKQIRVITGYGPQENFSPEEITTFYTTLEEEIASAELTGCSVILAMDANCKLGTQYVPGDPKEQTPNGKLLAGIVDRHAMCVANGLTTKRKGVITRERHTVNGIQRSVIDFVIFSNDLIKHIENIHVDEERVFVLTKNTKNKDDKVYKESDHNVINTKLKLLWNSNECRVTEVFKYNDKDSKNNFKKATTETKQLSQIICQDKSLTVVTNKMMKRLKGFIHQCFKKVKIVDKPNEELNDLYNKRQILRTKTDEKSKLELTKLNDELCKKYSDSMFKKIEQELKDTGDCEDGGFNSGKLWKLKKKLAPRNSEPPSAMEDKEGNVLTSKEDILSEAVKHYKNIFEPQQMADELKGIQKERELLCMKRLEMARQNKSPPWSVKDVTFVLNSLKVGKSKDPYDIPNELFKPDVAGDDLILAITKLMNRIKDELIYPKTLTVCNVTNLFKNKKKNKRLFDSYRGIFRTTVIRNILDMLMYTDEYEQIDTNLTNCNVGSRKRRNIRDNLFVINAIANESKQNPQEAIDLNVYDVRKCFDKMWLLECINDLYEAGLTNDKLVLLYETNKLAQIAIKTSSGITERFDIKETVMQGTVWAGLMCTVTMDKLCKQIYKNHNLLYKYRGVVEVPPLEMVDDIITTIKCGNKSAELHTTVNSFIEHKKLELSKEKCATIHIGNNKTTNLCPSLVINGELMKKSEKEKYLGDFVTTKANSKATIEDRKIRGNAIYSEMSAILRDIPLGNKRVRMGLALRQAWFLNGCLFNSEVWIGFSDSDLECLEIIDHKILRLITGAQAKVPIEMLYLETACIEVKDVIRSRRISYLHTILNRHPDEITNQIYTGMKNHPLKGDWIHLVNNDLDITYIDKNSITKFTKFQFKNIVKTKVRHSCFTKLEAMKQTHMKIKHIDHSNLNKPQSYLTSKLFNENQISCLFNLRCRSMNVFRDNFHSHNKSICPLCPICKSEPDTQEHALKCLVLKKHMKLSESEAIQAVEYGYIFCDIEAQLKVTIAFESVITLRERLCQDKLKDIAYPGSNTGPSG